MSKHEISCYFSNEGTRNEVRMRVINKFAMEEPGTGTDVQASKYRYYVETLETGNRVFLQRPANLHNGFDFLVCVEGIDFSEENKRSRSYPKHTDFGTDLELKKIEDPEMYRKLYKVLNKVFNCSNITDNELYSIKFSTGYPVDLIVKTMKWLFIEQDIRYWNYSGRNMTWDIVPPVD